jgi:hypothetical protein
MTAPFNMLVSMAGAIIPMTHAEMQSASNRTQYETASSGSKIDHIEIDKDRSQRSETADEQSFAKANVVWLRVHICLPSCSVGILLRSNRSCALKRSKPQSIGFAVFAAMAAPVFRGEALFFGLRAELLGDLAVLLHDHVAALGHAERVVTGKYAYA